MNRTSFQSLVFRGSEVPEIGKLHDVTAFDLRDPARLPPPDLNTGQDSGGFVELTYLAIRLVVKPQALAGTGVYGRLSPLGHKLYPRMIV